MRAGYSLALLIAFAATVLTAPARADGRKPGRQGRARPAAMAALERDLDEVFVRDGLTAERVARRAATRAPAIRRKTAELAIAEAEVDRAKLGLIPVLSGRASYTRLSSVEPVILPLGAQTFVIPFQVDSYALGAQLTVPLTDYLVRSPSLIASASLARDAAHLARQASAATVAQHGRELYYEWLRARLRVLVARRQVKQVRATLAQVRSLVDVQRVSIADALRVESQKAQAEGVLAQLASHVELREEQLRLLIGADDEDELEIGEDIRTEVTIPSTGEIGELMARAAAQRRELESLDRGIRAKRAQRRAEAAALAPRLSAFAALDYANPNPRVFPQEDRFRLTWVAGAQVTWVFNESLTASTTRRRLAAEAAVLEADRTQLGHQVRLEVLGASQAVALAERGLEISQQGIEAAEESYRVRKDLFSVGRATVVEMVDVETELTRARIAVLDARIDLRVAVAKLAYALGDDR